MMLRLKLQYFGHLMQRVDSLEKTLCWEGLGARGEGDDRGWDGWMASLTRWIWVWVSSGSWWWIGRPGVLRFMGSQRVGHNWATELNWTESLFMQAPVLLIIPSQPAFYHHSVIPTLLPALKIYSPFWFPIPLTLPPPNISTQWLAFSSIREPWTPWHSSWF